MKSKLADRYTPELIADAEQRRAKLDYETIHVGKSTTPRIERILKLLYETHQNYYFGHFEASCVLGGVLLEQCLVSLLEEEIEQKGSITYKQGLEVITIQDTEGLVSLNLRILINTASYYWIIPKDEYKLATTLRLIRNYLMHDQLGEFTENGDNYEYDFSAEIKGTTITNILSIPKKEIEEHCMSCDYLEIWAYFILTRTRHLISQMFRERVKRLPPENKKEEGL